MMVGEERDFLITPTQPSPIEGDGLSQFRPLAVRDALAIRPANRLRGLRMAGRH